MANAYDVALMSVTGPTTQTQFERFEEQWDVMIIADSTQVEFYDTWLSSAGGPTKEQWDTIKRNWISFLSATSIRPSADLAPNRRQSPKVGLLSDNDRIDEKRFERDCRIRSCVQVATYKVFDLMEWEAETWPRQARLIVSQACDSSATEPFQTLRARANLGKRRRYQSVWASLVCFLVYCYDNSIGSKDMGLQLNGTTKNAIVNIVNSIKTGKVGEVDRSVAAFCEDIFQALVTTASENAILWWLTVLVRSATDQSPDLDYISQGRFLMNILPMDLNLHDRIEAIRHYAKVFVLDLLEQSEQIPRDQMFEISCDRHSHNPDWLDDDPAQRPSDDNDPRRRDSQAWATVLDELVRLSLMYLRSRRDVDTVMSEVSKLVLPGRQQ